MLFTEVCKMLLLRPSILLWIYLLDLWVPHLMVWFVSEWRATSVQVTQMAELILFTKNLNIEFSIFPHLFLIFHWDMRTIYMRINVRLVNELFLAEVRTQPPCWDFSLGAINLPPKLHNTAGFFTASILAAIFRQLCSQIVELVLRCLPHIVKLVLNKFVISFVQIFLIFSIEIINSLFYRV